MRSWRSASWIAIARSSRSVPRNGSAIAATCCRWRSTSSAMTLISACRDRRIGGGRPWRRAGHLSNLPSATDRQSTVGQLVPAPGVRIGSLARVIPVRDDLRALEGYHSPQVDVGVRLNTNESPFPPPAAWRDAFAAELSRVDWHRYPDRAGDRAARGDRRAGTTCRPDRCSPPTARTRCCRRSCSRTPAPGARSPRSSRRTRCTPRSPASSAPPVVEGERDADFTLDPGRGAARGRRRPARTSMFLTLAEQPDRARRAGRPHRPTCSTWRPGSWWSTRPTPSSPTGRRFDCSTSTGRSWSPARSPRRGAWPASASATSSARPGSSRELEKVVLPYHLDVAKQIAGRLALRFVDEMDDRVRLIVAERERVVGRHARAADRRHAQRRQLRAVPAARPSAAGRVWQALARPQRARARLLGLAAARRLPARHHRHPRRERRLPRRPRRRSCR